MVNRLILSCLSILMATPVLSATASEICDASITRMIERSGLEIVETAEVFGCHRNRAMGFEYAVVETTQHDFVYEAISPEAVSIMQSVERMAEDPAFTSSLRFDRSTSEVITIGRYSRESRVDISDEKIMFNGPWLNNLRQAYFADFEVYALNNRTEERNLWNYMDWFISRRDITLDLLARDGNPLAGSGFKDAFGYGYLPWPWQLLHPRSIESFLEERAGIQSSVIENAPHKWIREI